MEHSINFQPWLNLYFMLGTSSAALVGLFFVAASLHLDELLKNPILKTRARNNAMGFIVVFLQCAAIMSPQNHRLLGLEIISLNLVGSFYLGLAIYRMVKGGVSLPIIRMGIFTVFTVIGVGGGVALVLDKQWAPYPVAIASLAYFVFTVANAWALMVGAWHGNSK